MNEEEIRKICNDIYEGGEWQPMIDYITNLERKIEQLEKYIEVKEQECNDLQEKIDKSIEYIEQHQELIAIIGTNYYKLLNILKGDNK